MPRKPKPTPDKANDAKAATMIEAAKVQIILRHPFFAVILLKRKLSVTRQVPTLAVSNKGVIYANPDFVVTLTIPQLVWGLCHEVMHVALSHAVRLNGRKPIKWNIAGDAVINDILDNCGIGERIPDTINMPGSRDKSADEIYAGLADPPKPPPPPEPPEVEDEGDDPTDGDEGDDEGDTEQDGDGPSKPSDKPPKGKKGKGGGQPEPHDDRLDDDGLGHDIFEEEPMSEAQAKAAEAEAKVEIAQAAQAAKSRGALSAPLAKFVADVLDSRIPWYEKLERFMTGFVAAETSWRRPNKRFISQGIYLPSRGRIPQMGVAVVVADVSGSIDQLQINAFNGHLSRIHELCLPTTLHVLYVDTEVIKHEEFGPDDEVKIQYVSGGGTHMPAAFDYLTKNGIDPEVIVFLTDGYTDFGKEPDVPVVWCISTEVVAPYGETIQFRVGD
jgi:hypothetical protein